MRLANQRGFSLIELITAMTITSMIVMMLYWAFALGSRVWDVQDDQTSTVQREEAFFRLLDQDFRGMVPYTMRWERGTLDFFSGGPTALFYVTRGGFGAVARDGKALFFACLVVLPNPEDGWDVALYKVPVPDPDLLEDLHSFQTQGEVSRRGWTPSGQILDEAVIFLERLSDVGFYYLRERPLPFQGATPQPEMGERLADQDAYQEEWLESGLPGAMVVVYEREGRVTEISLVPRLGAL